MNEDIKELHIQIEKLRTHVAKLSDKLDVALNRIQDLEQRSAVVGGYYGRQT